MEEWKIIDEFPDYMVSSYGRVLSMPRVIPYIDVSFEYGNFNLRRPNVRLDGYLNVILRRNSRSYGRPIHRLVAQAFIPNPKGLPDINHKNCVKTDNRVENLEWTTRKQNYRHGAIKGRFRNGCHPSRLNEQQVRDIKISLNQGKSRRKIAEEYDVSEGCIDGIWRGVSWRWVEPKTKKQIQLGRVL